MERSEPALVPEWLRSTGSVSSGGSSSRHFYSSSSDSYTRNRISQSKSDIETIDSSYLDRSSSTNSRRASSNGSAKHAYSSFNRSHRDKNRGRDKDRLSLVDPWDPDSSDPLGSILTSREKDQLRRSRSMVSRKQSELLSRRLSFGLKNGDNTNHKNHNNGKGVIFGSTVGNSFQKTVFEKDFPSLGSEYNPEVSDVARVSSPGLSSAVQSLHVGPSSLIAGEGWTSALAEVPNVTENSAIGSSSSLQTDGANTSMAVGTSGLNMAEALVQAPPRSHTPPQLSVKTQRLEELAIKQSRQLIPVTPSMPKGSVLNSSDKSKTKPVARNGEVAHALSRSAAQQPLKSLNSDQSHPGGQTKSDSSKKLLVLKPSRENGVYPVPKDGTNPTNDSNNGRAAGNHITIASSASYAHSVPVRSTNSPKGRKPSSLNMIPGLSLEKRPSLSQTQSRNDFFNLLKQKNSRNIPIEPPGSSPSITSSFEKADGSKGSVSYPSTPIMKVNYELTNKDDGGEGIQAFSRAGDKNTRFDAVVCPDEEEVAFLRSLGWEEHAGQDEGLTEEEISNFYEQYKKLSPSSKLSHIMPQKLSVIQETTAGVASSELSSSDSESDARFAISPLKVKEDPKIF